MKPIIYTLILSLLLFSCNNDDDMQKNCEPTLNNSWSLVNVSGGLAGVNEDFEVGLITWNFNQDNLELTVTNTNATNVIYDGLPSGTYDYELQVIANANDILVINTINYAITKLSSTELELDEGVAADGFLLKFSR